MSLVSRILSLVSRIQSFNAFSSKELEGKKTKKLYNPICVGFGTVLSQ